MLLKTATYKNPDTVGTQEIYLKGISLTNWSEYFQL